MNWKYLANEPPPADCTAYRVAVVNAKGDTKVLTACYSGAELVRMTTSLWGWTFYAYAPLEDFNTPPPLPCPTNTH